ncbi:MAG: hypothetical protein Q9M36_11950 [Sulfurovum sp.]|nr:hypothetical protein [Sulfurovum sp.]
MKKLLILLSAFALTLTLATAEGKCGEGKCGDSKTEKKCDAAKADKKCAAGKCGEGMKDAKPETPAKD